MNELTSEFVEEALARAKNTLHYVLDEMQKRDDCDMCGKTDYKLAQIEKSTELFIQSAEWMLKRVKVWEELNAKQYEAYFGEPMPKAKKAVEKNHVSALEILEQTIGNLNELVNAH